MSRWGAAARGSRGRGAGARGGIDVDRARRGDDDSIVARRGLDGYVTVQDIPEHAFRLPAARVAVATPARSHHHEAITGAYLRVRHLRGQAHPAPLAPTHDELGGEAGATAGESPRLELVAITLHRRAAIRQIGELADRAQAAAPLAGGAGVLTELVPLDPQGQVRFDVLDRVVPGVGVEGVHGVHAVGAVSATVAALEDLHVDPVLRRAKARVLGAQTTEGDDAKIADAGAHLGRDHRRQRLHHRVGELVAGAEAR